MTRLSGTRATHRMGLVVVLLAAPVVLCNSKPSSKKVPHLTLRAKKVFSIPTGKGQQRDVGAAISTDGKRIAYVGRKRGLVEIYSVPKRSLVRRLRFIERRPRTKISVGFSQDRRHLVMFSSDPSEERKHTLGNRLYAWRLTTGKLVLKRRFPQKDKQTTQQLYGFETRRAGRQSLLVAYYKYHIQTFSLDTGQRRSSIYIGGGEDQMPTFALSKDGRYVSGISRNDRVVTVYSPATGKLIKTLQLPPCPTRGSNCGNGVVFIAFSSPANALMVSNGYGAIWQLGTWKRRALVDDRQDVDGAKWLPAYSLEGSEVRLRSKRGPLIVWNLATGKRRTIARPRSGLDSYRRLETADGKASWLAYGDSAKTLIRHVRTGLTFRLVDHRGKNVAWSIPRVYGKAGAEVLLGLDRGTLLRWSLPATAP